MARKTAYEKAHISIQEKKGNNKDTKKRAWQYLFKNKPKQFSADELGVILGVDRTTAGKALNKLVEDKPNIERNIEYKVYKIDKSYCVLSKEQYEKHKAKQKKKQSLEDLTSYEALELSNNPKIWAADKAEDFKSEVVFYPIKKDKRYHNKVKQSLLKLFEEYIIAVLEGDKDGQSGMFIILKQSNDIDKIKKCVKKLYSQSAIYREKDK